jgi:hypothetical protein
LPTEYANLWNFRDRVNLLYIARLNGRGEKQGMMEDEFHDAWSGIRRECWHEHPEGQRVVEIPTRLLFIVGLAYNLISGEVPPSSREVKAMSK